MNYELIKASVQNKSEIQLRMWPSDDLETEFFNLLFSGNVIAEQVTIQDKRITIIKPTQNAQKTYIENQKLTEQLPADTSPANSGNGENGPR